jgi:hypothetical protein
MVYFIMKVQPLLEFQQIFFSMKKVGICLENIIL